MLVAHGGAHPRRGQAIFNSSCIFDVRCRFLCRDAYMDKLLKSFDDLGDAANFAATIQIRVGSTIEVLELVIVAVPGYVERIGGA